MYVSLCIKNIVETWADMEINLRLNEGGQFQTFITQKGHEISISFL